MFRKISAIDWYKFVSAKDVQSYKENNLTIIGSTGDDPGQTRISLRALRQKGPLEKQVIALHPYANEDRSPTTIINMHNGDRDTNEVEQTNQLDHPNLLSVIDTVELSEGRRANIVEDFGAYSLEAIVKKSGPLHPEKARKIMLQLLDAVMYLHDDKKMLHRDLKPSNVLVNPNSLVTKLGDLQNARLIDEIEEKALPTKGSTGYTHPIVLNGLMEGNSHATRKNEIFSLGAIFYYMLTGKELVDYQFQFDKDGKEFVVGDTKFNAGIFVNGSRAEKITLEEHDKRIVKALEVVPRKFMPVLRSALNYDSDSNSV